MSPRRPRWDLAGRPTLPRHSRRRPRHAHNRSCKPRFARRHLRHRPLPRPRSPPARPHRQASQSRLPRALPCQLPSRPRLTSPLRRGVHGLPGRHLRRPTRRGLAGFARTATRAVRRCSWSARSATPSGAEVASFSRCVCSVPAHFPLRGLSVCPRFVARLQQVVPRV